MKKRSLKTLLAGIAVLAILISCLLPGLVLSVSAAEVTASKFVLEVPSLHIMTGRYRDMSGTVTFSDDTTKKYTTKADMSWVIADTSIATVDDNGRITPLKVGKTTLTATTPADVLNSSGSRITKTIDLTVIDGSEYVYFNPEYTLGETNAIANGDFELGYTGNDWNLYGNGTVENPQTVDFATGVGKDGSAGLQLKSAADWQTKSLNNSVTAGNLYMLTFEYKANKGNIFSIYGGNLSIATTEFDLTGSKGTGEWKTYTKIFKMPYITSGSRRFIIYGKTVNADAPVVIDNVSLREYNSSVEFEELLLNHSEKKMMIGQSFRMEALTEPFGGNLNNLTWSTTDASVVTVDAANGRNPSNDAYVAYGLVKAVGEGSATITATTAGGAFSASCTITVSGGKGGSVMADPSLDAMDSTAWTTIKGKPAKFTSNGGAEGSAALVVDRYQPVSHTFTGLKPNATYTLQGVAKTMPISGHVVVTVVNGSQTLVTVNDKYTDWSTTETGEATLATGVKFTTPANLESDTTVVHIGVVLSDEDSAPTLATPAAKAAAAASSGKVEMGEDEVVDDEEDLTECTAYIDCLDIYRDAVTGVDLTPTYVQWKGDTDNDGQVTPGTPITFEVPVKNVGTSDLPAGDSFVIEIAANREVIRTFEYNGGIAAGQTVVVTDTAPWTAVAGDYMISARVNANYDIPETNPSTNQTYQLNLRVANDVYTPAYNEDIIAQAGMDRLTMSDDFNDLSTVDTLASGDEGYKWYVTRPWSGDRLRPHDYKTQDGVLTLMTEVPTYGIGFNSVDINTNNGYRYKHGYLEVRLRIPRPTDNDGHESGVPTVWSFTEDKAMENITGNDTHWVELDWLEYWGNTNQYPGGYYTTTFHQSTTVDADPSYSNSNHSLEGLGDAEWHVMGWLWEYNKIRTFLDGKEMMNMFIDPDAPLVPGARVNKQDENGNNIGKSNDIGLFSWANLEEAVLYLGGSKDNPELIDYVRIWQASEPEAVSDNMTLDKTEITMGERTREQLNVIVPNGEDAGTLSWKSSDPEVATVHGNGEVYARGAGKAVITATNANGITVMCKVTVTHNLFTNGDFEDDNDLLHGCLNTMLSGDGYEIVEESSGNHYYSMKYDANAVKYLNNWSVKKNTTYVLSGRWKGPSTMYAYFHSSYCQTTGNSKIGDVSLGGSDTNGDGWKEFSLEFTTAANPGNSPAYYTFGFRNKYGSVSTACLDDLKLVEKTNVEQSTYMLNVGNAANGSVSLKAGGSAISSGASVAPGTYIDVTVTPNSGYELALDGLTYSYTLPDYSGSRTFERKVLNKYNATADDSGFGKDNASTFRFVMPAEDTTLNAEFVASQDPVATLGTSVHVDGAGKADGVRFLNRMYYSRMDDSGVYVMYNGAEHKVAQFGSLLKRSTNEGELTLEAYNEHKNDSSATRIWKSSALRSGDVYLIDYTNEYVDFTITMTSSVANHYNFLNRGYTVCGYVVLEDGTTIYTDAITDSVLNALTRGL